MAVSSPTTESVLRLSPRITILPIVHASGDMAQEVREILISNSYDCLAVPLPESVTHRVEAAIQQLPTISVVTQLEEDSENAGTDGLARSTASYVPIDPCQPVIMGIRVAMVEGIPRAYIDRDVKAYEPDPVHAPDPYQLKSVSVAAYAAASLPTLPPLAKGSQREQRIAWMAFRLHELELDYHRILCLCAVQYWPYLREAYRARSAYESPESNYNAPETYGVSDATLYFMLGELPFITGLYEQRRVELRSDRHLSIDGVKELLLEARARWMAEKPRAKGPVSAGPGWGGCNSENNWLTPQCLQIFLQYVRNLALLDRRLTPDLYALVTAAKQIAGDAFAVTLIETAKHYPYQGETEAWRSDGDSLSFGIGHAEFPDGTIRRMKSRLPGPPQAWRTLHLRPKPTPIKRRDWAQRWNPLRQCSWPPEDSRIESFNLHVREQAKSLIGADLARTEKFTTSVKDGIDLRETLRHWHKREIYVKEIPPARGSIEVVVFLFDVPADPEKYSWQATWFAEHGQESTLCFYATPFRNNLVGPGIGESLYGGAMFLFPPRPIPDIWTDSRLKFAVTLEERLLAGALLHSQERHVAVVSPVRPLAKWRLLARRFRKQLIPIPLSRFSVQTVDRLRRFHVLNGHEVRSYAAKFIQDF
jgi:hypothetical protein